MVVGHNSKYNEGLEAKMKLQFEQAVDLSQSEGDYANQFL